MDREVEAFVVECAQAAAHAKKSAVMSKNPADEAFWLELAAEWENLASNARELPDLTHPRRLVRQ